MPPVERLSNLPPPARYDLPQRSPTDEEERRRRAIAHMDEMLAHLNDPRPEGEADWDVDDLFPVDRAR
ncbi:MAG: hypothetical protein U0324_36450 [Polyangiales bacterium]